MNTKSNFICSVTKSILNRLSIKLTSGRWIFTCVCAGVFAYLACAQILDPKDSLQVITVVLVFYFSKANVKEGNLSDDGEIIKKEDDSSSEDSK